MKGNAPLYDGIKIHIATIKATFLIYFFVILSFAFYLTTFFRLQVLNVSHNQIDAIPPTFAEDLHALRTLNLSYNQIQRIYDNALTNAVQLENFDASANRIVDISRHVFDRLTQLKSINLAMNLLSGEDFLQPIRSLRYLNMANNHFVTLDLGMFFQFHNVELLGNPWSCTWLIEEMMDASEGIHFGKNYSVDAHHDETAAEHHHHHLHQPLTVPGIDCIDESGKLRSIVVLHAPQNQRNDYAENIRTADADVSTL